MSDYDTMLAWGHPMYDKRYLVAKCESCGEKLYDGDTVIYDERSDIYYCGDKCMRSEIEVEVMNEDLDEYIEDLYENKDLQKIDLK